VYLGSQESGAFRDLPQDKINSILKDMEEKFGGAPDIIATCPEGQKFDKEKAGWCYDDIRKEAAHISETRKDNHYIVRIEVKVWEGLGYPIQQILRDQEQSSFIATRSLVNFLIRALEKEGQCKVIGVEDPTIVEDATKCIAEMDDERLLHTLNYLWMGISNGNISRGEPWSARFGCEFFKISDWEELLVSEVDLRRLKLPPHSISKG